MTFWSSEGRNDASIGFAESRRKLRVSEKRTKLAWVILIESNLSKLMRSIIMNNEQCLVGTLAHGQR